MNPLDATCIEINHYENDTLKYICVIVLERPFDAE